MPEPELFARPLGPDGEPVRDQWDRVGKIVMQPNPFLPEPIPRKPTNWRLPGLRPAHFMSEYTFTIKPGDEARVMSLFHGGPAWAWLAWLDGRGPAPVSRGTAWRTGVLAACQHQLTGPPKRHDTYIDAARRLATVAAANLYPAPGQRAATIAVLRELLRRARAERADLARDYPAPAEPCPECIAFGLAWRDRLRVWLDSMFPTLEPAAPTVRTDFMPRYPGR